MQRALRRMGDLLSVLRGKSQGEDVTIAGVARESILARCGGRCESCGFALSSGFECHHRKLRSQGGDWSLSNLLALHDHCHRDAHMHPAESYRLGFLVRGAAEPAESPLYLHRRRFVFLDATGVYR